MRSILYIKLIPRKSNFLFKKIDIGTKKINDSTLAIFNIVISIFLIIDKDEKVRFFKKIFLLANISLDMVCKISFLIFNNINIKF